MWCPSCGMEYRPGFTRCADCGVALTAEPPAEPATEAGEPTEDRSDGEHAPPVVYDLSDWPAPLREKLTLMMRGAAIPVVWSDGALLSVPANRESAVDGLIDDLDAHEEAPADASPLDDAPVGGRHACDDPDCPFGLQLTTEDLLIEVSWTRSDGDEVVFVPFDDVRASHGGDTAPLVREHAATLIAAADVATRLPTRLRRSDPNDDLAITMTLEDLADFAAELSTWCLDQAGDAPLRWEAATAVMRTVVAMSSLTDLLDRAEG